MNQQKSHYIAVFSKPMNPKLRLFCFPYAGAAAQVFKSWQDLLPESVQLCAIRLPGRGARFTEKPLTSLDSVLEGILRDIRPYLNMPFAFYGHSLGSMVSFELCRLLQVEGYRARCLIVSGRNAPHLPRSKPPIHGQPDEEFRKSLREFNGTPQVILDNEELMELMLPMIRADFTLAETYELRPGPKVVCPLISLGGEKDSHVNDEGVKAWGEHGVGGFDWKMLPGDHFFIDHSKELLLRYISEYLLKYGA